MAEYLSVEEGRARPGLRLVLTAGVPGPWGEAAKAVFGVKGVPFARVRQDGGQENAALLEWTGHANAPVAIYDDEPPRAAWTEILFLAERLCPSPSLIPADPGDRARMFGLSHEICGEQGLGWTRRLSMLHEGLSLPGLPDAARATFERLGARYGYSPAAAAAAPGRVVEILTLLDRQLAAQRDAGRRYLVGTELSAADLYWATFAALVDPLPEALCPMPEYLRRSYTARDPALLEAFTPELRAHRDLVYAEHLTTPLDF